MISKLDFSLLALIFEHFYLLMKILDREAQFGMDQINWAKNQDLENGEPPPISDHFGCAKQASLVPYQFQAVSVRQKLDSIQPGIGLSSSD